MRTHDRRLDIPRPLRRRLSWPVCLVAAAAAPVLLCGANAAADDPLRSQADWTEVANLGAKYITQNHPVATIPHPGNLQPFSFTCGATAQIGIPDCNWHDANTVEMLMDYYIMSGRDFWFQLQVPEGEVTFTENIPYIESAADASDFWINGGGPTDAWNRCNLGIVGDVANCNAGYNDDALWWALAFIRAYDAFGKASYLADAENIFGQICPQWGQTNMPCNGGIPWRPYAMGTVQINSITNELFLETAIKLHQRTAAGTDANIACGWSYLTWANEELMWFESKFWNHPFGDFDTQVPLVADQLDSECNPVQVGAFTYNQGVILGGLADMADQEIRVPGSTSFGGTNVPAAEAGGAFYIDQANSLAEQITSGATSLTSENTPFGPVLTESDVDFPIVPPNLDHQQFKGVFMRYLGRLHQWNVAHPGVGTQFDYSSFLSNNAGSIWADDRNCAYIENGATDDLGYDWSGPLFTQNLVTQTSAMDALIAAASVKNANLALGGTVTADRSDCPQGARAVADGVLDTPWCAFGDGPHWVEIRLPQRTQVTGVTVVRTLRDDTVDAFNHSSFTLQYTLDGGPYVDFAKSDDLGPTCDVNWANRRTTFQVESVTASTVRMWIDGTGGDTCTLDGGGTRPCTGAFEIEVYGFPQPEAVPPSCAAGGRHDPKAGAAAAFGALALVLRRRRARARS